MKHISKILLLLLVVTVTSEAWLKEPQVIIDNFIQVPSDLGQDSLINTVLTATQTRKVFFEIESGSNYYAKSRWTTAQGGFQFVKRTRRGLFRVLPGVNWSNWLRPSNQIKMFNKHYSMNRKVLNGYMSYNIYVSYLTWQLGVGGFREMDRYIKGNVKRAPSETTLNNNMPLPLKHKFQRYAFAEYVKLIRTDPYARMHSGRVLKGKRITHSSLTRALKACSWDKRIPKVERGTKYFKKVYKPLLDKILLQYAISHRNYYVSKLNRVIVKLGY